MMDTDAAGLGHDIGDLRHVAREVRIAFTIGSVHQKPMSDAG